MGSSGSSSSGGSETSDLGDSETTQSLEPIQTSTENPESSSSSGSGDTSGSGSSSNAVDSSSGSGSSSETGFGSGSGTTGEELECPVPKSLCNTPEATCGPKDPGCLLSCQWDTRHIFLSSAQREGNLTVQGADDLCQELATDAGLCGTFGALIQREDGFWGPVNDGFEGYFVLSSGAQVTKGFERVITLKEDLLHPINEDEKGVPIQDGSVIWTGYDPNSAQFTCMDFGVPWISNANAVLGYTGVAGGPNRTWYDSKFLPCNTLGRIYCVELGT